MNGSARIRFIEPRGRRGRPFNAWITRWPMLGPITLATILRKRGYDAAVYNENVSGPLLENDEAYRDMLDCDVVGISIMTPTANRGYEIADALKRDRPELRVVFGGVHATFMPDEAMKHADIVVRGEGETVIEDIASGAIKSGIIDAPRLEDLDSIPTLDHTVMYDFERLTGGLPRRLYELPVMTSRGCPHACTYCSVTRMFGRRVRRQSAGKVCEDARAYAARGFHRLMFYDDNFTTDREWSRRVLEGLAPLNLRFNAQVRADFHRRSSAGGGFDAELLNLMRRAGGNMLFIGYETIDDETARHWHKGYQGRGNLARRLMEDTRILHEHGFWIHGMFVLGPQHNESVARNIVKFARRCGLETLQISVLTPFPGTPLFREMEPHLVLRNFPVDWDFYDGTHCVYNHGRLGIEKFQRTVLSAHKRFYRNIFSITRLRRIMRESLPLRDKIALLRRHVKIARTTMREWRLETESFIEFVKQLKVLPSS